MKLKEGAENLRKASKDKRSHADVERLVKQANIKLDALNLELQEVQNYLMFTTTDSGGLARNSRRGSFPSLGEGFYCGELSLWRVVKLPQYSC